MLRRSAHGHMLEDLKACKTRRALANVLEIPEKELTYVLYSDEAKPLYKSFCISKKSGGTDVTPSFPPAGIRAWPRCCA